MEIFGHPALVPTMFIVGCSKEEGSSQDPQVNLPDVPMAFDLSISPFSSENPYLATQWLEGDAVGLFAFVSGSDADPESCVLDNVKLVYSGGKWQTDEVESLLWPEDASLDFFAYYPYDSGNTGIGSLKFSAAEDQDSEESFRSSDVMTAEVSGIARGEDIEMDFTHLFSLLKVSIPGGLRDGADDNLGVYLTNVEASADLDGNVEGTAGDFEMKMYSVGKDGEAYVYLAMLPGQTVSSGTQLFSFRSESGQEVPCDALDADVVLFSGNMTELSRTVEGLIHTVRIEPGTFVMGSPETEQ